MAAQFDEYLRLGFEEASKREDFARRVSRHIDHAREKHKFFACGVTMEPVETLTSMAALYRTEARKPWADVHMVAMGELYEFLEALAKGDYEAAREEAADLTAVLYRALAKEHEALSEQQDEPVAD